MTATTFDQSIASLDVSIFRIESQTSIEDRRSFLAIQNAVRLWKNEYIYLECGSHIGGSLLPHVLDPHCRLLYSVDKRPPVQPDERGIKCEYRQNSSQRMVATLARHVSVTYLAKVRTFDMDASELTAYQIPEKPDLVLIDAEHTNAAVFRDFLNLCLLCHPSTVYIFHDADLTFSGLQNIEMFLRYNGVAFDSYVLPSVVYLLAINDAREILRPVGEKFGMNKDQFAAAAREQLMMFHYELVRALGGAFQSRTPPS
jgi:Methyltransferase domain